MKTLQDSAASTVNLSPKATTIAAIRTRVMYPSDGVRQGPYETQVWKVNAVIKAAKIEDDNDVHLMIADPKTGGTMIAEVPVGSGGESDHLCEFLRT